jgi:hypothetical protein
VTAIPRLITSNLLILFLSLSLSWREESPPRFLQPRRFRQLLRRRDERRRKSEGEKEGEKGRGKRGEDEERRVGAAGGNSGLVEHGLTLMKTIYGAL